MTDPLTVSTVAPAAEVAATQAQGPSRPPAQTFEPSETRMFANLMQDVPGGATTSPPGSLRETAMAYASQFNSGAGSYEDLRRSMLESIDMSDPIRTMFVMTDHSMQAHTMFAKLHISTGLASAATSLFGTLLKNQQ